MPVKVWQLSTARPPHIYGLRRLTACAALGHPSIPAFLRPPQSIARALAAMVPENEIRTPVSPWEKAALILNIVEDVRGGAPGSPAAVAA